MSILVPEQEPYLRVAVLKRNRWATLCSMRKLRRQSRKLLVLRLPRQAVVGFGVVDDFTEKLQAEWRERALPQFPGGLALLDEAPLLGGDRATVHEIGKMVHGAAGDRIAFPDGPFHRSDAAVARQQRGMIADAAQPGRGKGSPADARMAVRRHDQVGAASDFGSCNDFGISLHG